MNDVFITRFSSECVGGLPGLCLTMAEVVKDDVRLHGPHGMADFLFATQRFMKISRFNVPFYEDLMPSTQLCDDVTIHSLRFSSATNGQCSHICYVGETAVIKGKFDVDKAAQLKVPKGPLYGKLKNGEAVTLPTGEMIEPSQVLGDAEPPRYFVIICNVADSPDGLIQSMASDEYLLRFAENGDLCNQLECIIHLSPPEILQSSMYSQWALSAFSSTVKHISGYGGRSSFHAAALHTTKLHKVCPSFFGDLSSLSSSPSSSGASSTGDKIKWYTQGQPLMKITLSPGHKRNFEEAITEDTKNEAEVFFNDALKTCPDLTADLQSLDALRRSVEVMSPAPSIVDQYRLTSPAAMQLTAHTNNHLLFLGTGCAVPSKYRNVSGILLQFSSSRSSMLIDVGEGTWQQLLKIARLHPSLFPEYENVKCSGEEDSCALAAALQLKLAWISHPHADHHLGLITVILQRRQLLRKHCRTLYRPLVLIASTAVLLFLHDCCTIIPHLSDGYIPVSCRQFDPLDKCDLTDAYYDLLNEQGKSRVAAAVTGATDGEVDIDASSKRPAHIPLAHPRRRCYDPITALSPCTQHMTRGLAAAQECFQSMGIGRLQNVPVAHCSQSYGLILESTSKSNPEDRFKLVYSGDTRPCANLIQYGQHATILIHEGTFEDDKWSEAVVKKHSTIGEALDSANSMEAYRVILTHFSQRYPSMPMIDAPASTEGAMVEGSRYGRLVSRDRIHFIVAFDFMHVSFGQLLWAPAVVPLLEKAFPTTANTAADEDQEELEAGTTNTVGAMCTCTSGQCATAMKTGQLCVSIGNGTGKKSSKNLKRKAQSS